MLPARQHSAVIARLTLAPPPATGQPRAIAAAVTVRRGAIQPSGTAPRGAIPPGGAGRARRCARLAAGWLLLVAGATMLFLPLPGLPAFLAGLALLERDVPWTRRLRAWACAALFDLPATACPAPITQSRRRGPAPRRARSAWTD